MKDTAPHLCLLGAGLLGASLGMAARERGLAGRVTAWTRSAEGRAGCARAPWCDAVAAHPEEAVAGADRVILCVPVEHIPGLLARIHPHLHPRARVTDVGSTKEGICAAAARIFTDRDHGTFLGSHPLAGGERTGMAHARPDLFAGRTCLLTPPASPADPRTEADLRAFWEGLGMRVHALSPREHDTWMARTSHLPHALASTLCAFLATEGEPREVAARSGPGLLDTTRVAAGDPVLWTGIFRENREALLSALDACRGRLDELRGLLAADDAEGLCGFLRKGADLRRALDP